MDEFQILSLFNSGLISNGLYTAAAFFLLWVAFRGALIIYNEGAPLLNKIFSTIFSLGIVYVNLRNLALLDVNWESTAFARQGLWVRVPYAPLQVDFGWFNHTSHRTILDST